VASTGIATRIDVAIHLVRLEVNGRSQTTAMAGITQRHSRTMMTGQLYHHGTRPALTDPSPGCGEYAGSYGGVVLIAGV
jgi:hypothetical protein